MVISYLEVVGVSIKSKVRRALFKQTLPRVELGDARTKLMLGVHYGAGKRPQGHLSVG